MSSKSFVFGREVDLGDALTPDRARALCREARAAQADVDHRPREADLWTLLDALARVWGDPMHPLRVEAQATLPGITGFSAEMIALGLDALASDLLSSEALRKKVRTELRGIPGPLLPGVRFDHDSGTSTQWKPLGVVLHVLAGNVFLGGVGSLLEGLLTGNASLLKMSSDETFFLPLFLKSLSAHDPQGLFTRRIACFVFPSSARDVMDAFKEECDGVVVWGGEQAVRGWRERLPASCRLVVFGPKLSVAVVTKAGMAEHGVEEAARRLADELAIWDQNACTAPQVCFVEGTEHPRALLDALAKACAARQTSLPAGQVDFATACEIRKIRGLQSVREALGEGLLAASPQDLAWTVYTDASPDIATSPLHRTLRIVPFSSAQALREALAPVAPQLQTLGLLTGASEDAAFRESLADAGALRLLPLGAMAGGESDDPHDGAYDLPQLLKLVCHRHEPRWRHVHPDDRASPEARTREIADRLALLERSARRTPLYAERLAHHGPLSLETLERFPRLTRLDLELNMPPAGLGLLAPDAAAPAQFPQAFQGGYVTRSGGSTGEPKFSVYDKDDWDAMMDHGVRVFLAAGLRPGTRLANCFLAGDLYGSFVSFDHINARVGVTTFGFGSAVTGVGLADAWRKFGLDAVMGVPATIVPALRAAHALEPALRIETVVFAGQPMSRVDAQWLRTVLGVNRLSSIIGANDGGQIGYQCEHLEGAFHHAVDEYNYLEFVDDEGRPVPEGTAGRILVTTLRKHRLPLIRYDIGDRGRLVRTGCACGRRSRVFEYLGRADDMVTVGLMNLPLSDLRRAVETAGGAEMQLVIRSDERGESLEVRVERSLPGEGQATHGEKETRAFRDALLVALPVVAARLEEGRLADFQVTLVSPGGIARNLRTGKIAAVLDER